MVHKVESTDEFNQSIAKSNLTVVDFYADWCGPCRMISPYVDELSTKYADVNFIKVDVDQLEDVAAKCSISAMPTFQFYKNGEKVAEFRGADKAKLLETLQKSQ